MSPSTDGTDGAAEPYLRCDETGALVVATTRGAMQSSGTLVSPEEHRREIQAELLRLDEGIAGNTTNKSQLIGPGVALGTDPTSVLIPEDHGVSHDNPSSSHAADEHSRPSFVESESQPQVHCGIPKALVEPSTNDTSTVTASIARESEDIENEDTQPTSVGTAPDEDAKSECPDSNKACYDTDSDRSNGSDLGSSDLPPIPPFKEEARGLGAWLEGIPSPPTEVESGIQLQSLDPGYAPTRAMEAQGATTTALQSTSSKGANQARGRKNASSQPPAFQSPGAKSRYTPRHLTNESADYQQQHELPSAGTSSKASPYNQPASASPFYINIKGTHPKALSRKGAPPASSGLLDLEAQHNPERASHKIMKGIIVALDLLAATIFGIVAKIRGGDTMVICTVLLVVLGVGSLFLMAL